MKNCLKPNPYQLIALTKLLINEKRFLLITDGVGVGKTISAAYIASYFSKGGENPIVIVSPNILVNKWRMELKQKFKIDSFQVTDMKELETAESEIIYAKKLKKKKAYVFSHSMFMRKNFETTIEPVLIIIDEIHNFRNVETIGFQNLLPLCEKSKFRVGLSATPINNDLEDLTTEMKLLIPDANYESLNFAIKEVWQSRDYEILSPFLTRFEKEHLGVHFAKREIQTHWIEYHSNYVTKVRNIIKDMKMRKRTDSYFMDEMTFFRLASSSPKAIEHATKHERILEIHEDDKIMELGRTVEKYENDRIIIFCEFIETAKYVSNFLRENRPVFLISGKTANTERFEIMKDFENTEKAILVMTSVGSEGLDLQFCSVMINYDIHWNPMKIEQRIGRIDRIGQKKEKIAVHNFIVTGSIDEKIINVLSKKMKRIKNSIFAPKDIISKQKRKESNDGVNLLPSEDIMDKERGSSKQLIDVMDNTSKIRIEDYEIVDAISERYCDPEMISKLEYYTKIPWIQNERMEKWVSKNVEQSDELDKIIEAYS